MRRTHLCSDYGYTQEASIGAPRLSIYLQWDLKDQVLKQQRPNSFNTYEVLPSAYGSSLPHLCYKVRIRATAFLNFRGERL